MRDTDYYDAESSQYSSKRYPAIPTSYIQSFYLKRLATVLSLIKSDVRGSNLKLLEIGCADGVVTNKLFDLFSAQFSSIAGVDISSGMIASANARKGARNIAFGLREGFVYENSYDLIVEVGVINYADDDEELRSAASLLAADSYFLCSLAGADSLKNRLKHDEAKGFNNFRRYAEYEKKIHEKYSIIKVVPIGLFIPHIWKVPAIARLVQPLAEAILSPIAPDLFHEKVYLLRPLPSHARV